MQIFIASYISVALLGQSMEPQGGCYRYAGRLIGGHILAIGTALDNGAEVIEYVATRLPVLESVAGDVLEGVVEEALEDVVHDQSASRQLSVALVTGSAGRHPGLADE